MSRKKWTCPGCNKVYSISLEANPKTCPACKAAGTKPSKALGGSKVLKKHENTERASNHFWNYLLGLTACAIVVAFVVVWIFIPGASRDQKASVPDSERLSAISNRNEESLAASASEETAIIDSGSVPSSTQLEAQTPAAPDPLSPSPSDTTSSTDEDKPPSHPDVEKPAPTEVIFPTNRVFNHPSKIMENPGDDNSLTLTMMSRADNQKYLFMADLLMLRAAVDQPYELHDVGQVRFYSYVKDWIDVTPLTIKFVVDKQEYVFPCRREDEILFARVHIVDFAKLLTASKIEVTIESIKFELEMRHLEAMRDLASRVPDGLTRNKKFLVRHEPDLPQTDDSADSTKVSSSKNVFELSKQYFKNELNSKLNQLDRLKNELKQSVIADDKKSIDVNTKKLKGQTDEIKQFLKNPFRELDLANLKAGQIGHLAGYAVTIAELIDYKKGEAFCYAHGDGTSAALKIAGMDPKLLAGDRGISFDDKVFFIVIGQTIHRDLSRPAQYDCFELQTFKPVDPFAEVDRRSALEAVAACQQITLTEQEAAEAERARERKTNAGVEKEKLAKAKRSKSLLQSAKSLLAKNQTASAKKFLEKAVAEDPDSEAGKEAAKMLEELP